MCFFFFFLDTAQRSWWNQPNAVRHLEMNHTRNTETRLLCNVLYTLLETVFRPELSMYSLGPLSKAIAVGLNLKCNSEVNIFHYVVKQCEANPRTKTLALLGPSWDSGGKSPFRKEGRPPLNSGDKLRIVAEIRP